MSFVNRHLVQPASAWKAGSPHLKHLRALERSQFDPPDAIESPIQNEPYYVMELAAIEKGPVPFAHVDDRSRQAAEVAPVDELSAARRRPDSGSEDLRARARSRS